MGGDREFLLSVFLMEAWDTLGAIEDDLPRLADAGGDASAPRRRGTETSSGSAATSGGIKPGSAPPPQHAAIERLCLVTHRLKGSAALNGFPELAALAAAMEEAVNRAAEGPAGTRPAALESLGEMVAALRTTLDVIGATGEENAAVIKAVLARSEPLPDATARALDALDRFVATNPDALEYFVPEATEHLDAMAQSLFALERGAAGATEIAQLFRAVHTLKGAAYTVGCGLIGDLAHRVEDLLGEVREGRRALDPLVIEAVFAGLDALRLLLRTADGAPTGRAQALGRAATLLDTLPAPGEPTAATAKAPPASAAIAAAGLTEWAPAGTAAASQARRKDAPRQVRPSIRVNLDRLDALMNLVGELVIARGRLERHLSRLEEVGGLLEFTQSRMGQTVAEFESKYQDPRLPVAKGSGALTPESVRAEPSPAVEGRPAEGIFEELEFDRYDDFNLLSRRVREIASDVSEIQLHLASIVRAAREDAARVQHLSGQLRGEITRARMVPLGRLFARVARQVREAARAAGKRVALEVQGDTVEMDNTIVEQIGDPLLHLIQNAIAHGIESEAERRARGKPPYGTLRLSAAHRSGAIYVELADDGRGIDVDVVKQRALARGFLRPEAVALATDRELLDLIFLPGFSTAGTVTTAAGRGVGLDVVRTNVGQLGGEIEVATQVGAGTTFTLKLPLTVAISDAVLVRVGTEVLAIAVPSVRASLRVRAGDIETSDGVERIRVDDQLAELIHLGRVLGLPADGRPSVLPVVALRAGRRTLAVAVDELLGKEEIAVKSLGRFLEGRGLFAGATVSPEGRVILLLDPLKLADAPSGEALAPAPGGQAPASVAVQRPRVLLVDDSLSVRKFIGQMLERAGFAVMTATDGVEALERVGEELPSVIITDLEMPRLNGYELIRDLRRRPSTRELPVVVLTTRAGSKHTSLAQELGVAHCVTKPVDAEAFVRLVESLAVPAGLAA